MGKKASVKSIRQLMDAFLLPINYFVNYTMRQMIQLISKRIPITLFLLLFAFLLNVQAQQNQNPENILIQIEDAFRLGDVNKIADLIDSNTHFSFTSELTGYFSYSQIISLMGDYFKTYKPLKFRFSSRSFLTSTPFAWGEYVFLKRGIRGSHKIFISIENMNGEYRITQISINP